MEKPKLTNEQKIVKLQQQIKKLKNQGKEEERKNRARNLIQIGAVVSSVHSHQEFYEYLQNEQQRIKFITYLKQYIK